MVLAIFLGGAASIEIAQKNRLDAAAFLRPAQNGFQHQLGFAIGVGGPLQQNFRHGHDIGLAIGGACGGKNDFLHAGSLHGIKQVQAAANVIFKIKVRLLHGLAHQRIGGKVNHRIRLDGLHGIADAIGRAQIANDEAGARVHGFAMAALQIVKHGYLVTVVAKQLGGHASNIAGAACHQYLHSIATLYQTAWARAIPFAPLLARATACTRGNESLQSAQL